MLKKLLCVTTELVQQSKKNIDSTSNIFRSKYRKEKLLEAYQATPFIHADFEHLPIFQDMLFVL